MVSESFRQTYDAAHAGAVSIGRQDRAWLLVSGKDRASYLQGLLTNDIPSLSAGHGCYAAYLTPQGRMISDLTVYELGDVILLGLPQATRETVLSKLDQFIFSEDVQLGDVSETFTAISVIGPGAAAALAPLLDLPLGAIASLPSDGNLRATFQGAAAIVLRVTDRGADAFDVLVERADNEAFAAALQRAGVLPGDPSAIDVLRIEAGIPRFGADMDETTIPLEAGLETRAISFTKGCYVGQEVIIRVLHRGHGRVAKKLVGLVISAGDTPSAGATIEAPEMKPIGTITSAGWSPRLDRSIALGYVHRDFVAPGTPVRVLGHEAVVSALPFHQ